MDYAALTKELDLPNLTQLAIYYPEAAVSLKVRIDVTFRKAMHFYSAWSTPRLRSFISGNFIPVPFSGTKSLALLHVVLNLNRNVGRDASELDVESFLSFLSTCPNLETLAFVVSHAKYATVPPLPRQHSEMPCVSKLDLDFAKCRSAPLKIFFNAIRFPHGHYHASANKIKGGREQHGHAL